jgi:hypothetical protein
MFTLIPECFYQGYGFKKVIQRKIQERGDDTVRVSKKCVNATVAIIAISLFFAIGCSRKQEQKPVASVQEAPAVNAAEAAAFRKKLEGMGVPVYTGAVFVEVKRSAKDSPLLYAVYETPDEGGRSYNDVKAFYARKLRGKLVPQGWVVDRSAENVIAYRKGFDIFYVELSRAIVIPDTRKIRISLYYGQ